MIKYLLMLIVCIIIGVCVVKLINKLEPKFKKNADLPIFIFMFLIIVDTFVAIYAFVKFIGLFFNYFITVLKL